MTIQISKKTIGVIVAGVILLTGSIYIGRSQTRTRETPYAGVAGADLPTVVGEPTLDTEIKIPFTKLSNYQEYTPELFASVKADGNAALLFFYADWCGSCKAQEPMNAAFFSQALERGLPLTGIRIDIDDHKDIAREYGINYQHSYVLLDKTGTPVSKFFGEHTPEQLSAQVTKVL